jgi:hypothetical protein
VSIFPEGIDAMRNRAKSEPAGALDARSGSKSSSTGYPPDTRPLLEKMRKDFTAEDEALAKKAEDFLRDYAKPG